MPKGKMKVLLEVATEIIQRVSSALCHEKNIEKAEELQEIMRQLIVFSDRLNKKQKSVADAKTLAALNAMDRAVHGREETL